MLCVGISFMPACKRTVREHKSNMMEYETQIYDIPVYLGAQNITFEPVSDSLSQMSYLVNGTLPEISQFYSDEMERNGWSMKMKWDTQELVRAYKKPYSTCLVSLRKKNENQVEAILKFERIMIPEMECN